MTRNRILLAVVAVLCLVALGSFFFTGRAPQAVPQAAPVFIIDDAGFAASTKRYHAIPLNDPKLEFDISLPTDWTVERVAKSPTATANERIPEDVARFKSPMMGTQQASVTVQYLRLERGMTAENWLKEHAALNGYALEGPVSAKNETGAEISFLSVADGKTFHTRMAVRLNSNAVMLARFDMPAALKESLSFLQKKSIDSFRLTVPSDDPAEPQKSFTLADALKFYHPQSWTVNYPDLRTTDSMSVQLHNEDAAKKLNGLIRFAAVRRHRETSLSKEIERMKKYFDEDLGIVFKKMSSFGDAPNTGRFAFARQEIYRVSSKKQALSDQELRIVILGDEKWYVFVFLLTPSERESLPLWAVNTFAFDNILKSIR